MSAHALPRFDLALIGASATASGVSNAVSMVAGSTSSGALRFLELAVVNFTWHGLPAYLTPTDLIAILSAAILLIRFGAWMLAPVFRLFRGGSNGAT